MFFGFFCFTKYLKWEWTLQGANTAPNQLGKASNEFSRRKWKWTSLSHVRFFATPCTIKSVEFSRPEYWSGAIPFSRGSSQPRDQTQVSCTAVRFFTSWATREAQEYWSGQPVPSPLLQRIFLTQELNRGLLHWRWILYQLIYHKYREIH